MTDPMDGRLINGELLAEDLEFLSDREQEMLSGGRDLICNCIIDFEIRNPAGVSIPGQGLLRARQAGAPIPWFNGYIPRT